MTAEIVGERQPGALDLPFTGSSLQLQGVLVEHSYPRRARGMPEGLEPAVGVDG